MSGRPYASSRGPRRCDVCWVTPGETKRRILRFSLIIQIRSAKGTTTTRSCGSILLCEKCWQSGPAQRRRPGTGRPRTVTMATASPPVVSA